MIMLIIFCMLYCSPVSSINNNSQIQAEFMNNTLLSNKIIECSYLKKCSFIKQDQQKMMLYAFAQYFFAININIKKTAINMLNAEVSILKKNACNSIEIKELKTDFKNLCNHIKYEAFKYYLFISKIPKVSQQILCKDDVRSLLASNLKFEHHKIGIILEEFASYDNRDNLATFLLKLILYNRNEHGAVCRIWHCLPYSANIKQYYNGKIKFNNENDILSHIFFVNEKLTRQVWIYNQLSEKANNLYKVYTSIKNLFIYFPNKISYVLVINYIVGCLKTWEINIHNALNIFLDNANQKFDIKNASQAYNSCRIDLSNNRNFRSLVAGICNDFGIEYNVENENYINFIRFFILHWIQYKNIIHDCCQLSGLLGDKVFVDFIGGNVLLTFDKSLSRQYNQNLLAYEVFIYNNFVSEMRDIICRPVVEEKKGCFMCFKKL